MDARGLFVASISTGLVLGIDAAYAQDEQTNVQNLPAVEVVAPQPTSARRSPSQAPTRVTARPRVKRYVYPTSPAASGSVDVDKIPASINAVDSTQIRRTDSLNITNALEQYVPGVSLNEVTGNPFQPSVDFRGFVASPV